MIYHLLLRLTDGHDVHTDTHSNREKYHTSDVLVANVRVYNTNIEIIFFANVTGG